MDYERASGGSPVMSRLLLGPETELNRLGTRQERTSANRDRRGDVFYVTQCASAGLGRLLRESAVFDQGRGS